MSYLNCGHCGQEWTQAEVGAGEADGHRCHAGDTAKEYEARISHLEVLLLDGVKNVSALLSRKKEMWVYKSAGDWREAVNKVVVNYGTTEDPCSVPAPSTLSDDCDSKA